MQREPDPVKVLVAIVPLPLFPLFRSHKLRTRPCAAAVMQPLSYCYIISEISDHENREHYQEFRLATRKISTKDPSLPPGKSDLKEDWSKSKVLRQIMKVVGGIIFPTSARVCGERWHDPGPPPVIPPPAQSTRVLRELRAIIRVSRAPDLASVPADIWNDILSTPLMTSWAPLPGGGHRSAPWWELTLYECRGTWQMDQASKPHYRLLTAHLIVMAGKGEQGSSNQITSSRTRRKETRAMTRAVVTDESTHASLMGLVFVCARDSADNIAD